MLILIVAFDLVAVVDDPGATVKCLDPTTTPGPTTTPATTAARTTPPKTTANAKQTTAPGTGTTTGETRRRNYEVICVRR